METFNSGFITSFGEDPNWEDVINTMDTNNDGHIDYDEFLTAASDRAKLINRDNLKAAFKVFDKNEDGKITIDEI